MEKNSSCNYGSRSWKQIWKWNQAACTVGPNGEIIMDYSIRDALEAGFNKIVFIIRKDTFLKNLKR